jgi:hypothetical protein
MASSQRHVSSESGSGVLEVLSQLERVTQRLHSLGRVAALLTLLSFLCALGVVGLQRASETAIAHLWGLPIGLAFPLAAIAAIFQFDMLKRKGDILFKELSDELQWYVRYGREQMGAGSEPSPEYRPQLRARIVLREYAYSTTLPLVSSTNGPLMYAVANVSFALIAAVLSTLVKL